ncbi:hypothetical protein PDESU_03710 [Pontiella desulfatans]|uniref:Uncharacterized protein n=2 Tax=Pontiella desulfatans TaxID=2750659 RepID=A0A6C2U5L1_PONDE|nr:hypothetical protein PDESU_03710 [Pontiella desulfatans]
MVNATVLANPVVDVELLFGHHHRLNRNVYGANAYNISRPYYKDNGGFVDKYNALGKPAIRYPGGTAANYLDQATGWHETWPGATTKDTDRANSFNNGLINNGKSSGHDYMPFANFLVQTDAAATYVYNITTMTDAQNRTVLENIAATGAEIDCFEIGNELYYGQYAAAVPDVHDYISKAQSASVVIRDIFPNAKIGVIIPSHLFTNESFLPDGAVNDGDRQELWYSELQDENFFDAVVIHTYASVGMDGSVTADNFLSYEDAYDYSISHIDAKFNEAFDRIKTDFPGKEVFVTEYHVGGFSGDVRQFRLRYSYLGAFVTGQFMMKMFGQDHITLSSWHSMAQWFTYSAPGSNLLPDPYAFGTTLNYDFFGLFKEPVQNSDYFTPVRISGASTYNGVGGLGSGSHAEVEGGNFVNAEAGEGYLVLFNKQTTPYDVDLSLFELANGVVIQEINSVMPDDSLPLVQAVESEATFTQNTVLSPMPATLTLMPYSMHIIRYNGGGLTHVLVSEDFEGGLGDWMVTDDVTIDSSAQSPVDNAGADTQGVLFYDDANTASQMTRDLLVDGALPLTIQFDYLYTGSVTNPGVQLRQGGATGINVHMTSGDGKVAYKDGSSWIKPGTELNPNTWYRFTLNVQPADTADDRFDLRIQSLESADLDATYDNLGFQNDLADFDTLRFHYNTGVSTVGGEYRIDNIQVFTSENLGLNIYPGGARYNSFVFDHGLSGDPAADFDNDGLLDYGEYVFGGNPTNGWNDGARASFHGGNYIFSLIGDSNVTAHVASSTNLLDGAWETNETVHVAANDGLMKAYTNDIGTSESQRFIQLELAAPE